MDSESFSSLAELALGLSGFAGVVITLRSNPRSWHPIERLRILALLALTLATAVIALLPILFTQLGYQEESSARVSSGIALLLGSAWFAATVPRFARFSFASAPVAGAARPRFFLGFFSFFLVNLAVQLANALSWLPLPPLGVFYGGVLGFLASGMIGFLRTFLSLQGDQNGRN